MFMGGANDFVYIGNANQQHVQLILQKPTCLIPVDAVVLPAELLVAVACTVATP